MFCESQSTPTVGGLPVGCAKNKLTARLNESGLDSRVLAIVAGHCSLRSGVDVSSFSLEDILNEDNWCLNEFQRQGGELPLVLGHIRSALVVASCNRDCVVCFSGGYTQPGSGREYCEGESYLKVASRLVELGMSPLIERSRLIVDEKAYSSGQNIIGSLERYFLEFGAMPGFVLFISYPFKAERMLFIARQLGLEGRMGYLCSEDPILNEGDYRREGEICKRLISDPFLEDMLGEEYRKILKRNYSNAALPVLNPRDVAEYYRYQRDGFIDVSFLNDLIAQGRLSSLHRLILA